MTHLLDTDTCIALLRGHPEAIRRARGFSPDDLAVSSVTHYELFVGVRNCAPARQRTEGKKVETLLSQIHEIPFTSAISRRSADLRVMLQKAGTPIGPMDILSAGTALTENLILVTGNRKEFERIPDLIIECWT